MDDGWYGRGFGETLDTFGGDSDGGRDRSWSGRGCLSSVSREADDDDSLHWSILVSCVGGKNFIRRCATSGSSGKPVDELTAPLVSWNGVTASVFKGCWACILFRCRRQKLRKRIRRIKNNKTPIMQPMMSPVDGDEDDDGP